MESWTTAIPGRLDYERQAFEEADGLDFALDEAELENSGRVVFRGTLTREGTAPVNLEVRYPDSFPYLRPEVFAPDLHLERHQNPFRSNLCLLERSTRQWSPTKTGAWLVSVRVPHLLELIESGDPERMRREEAAQGEPASNYFIPALDAAVFVPEEMLALPHDQKAGIARLSIGPGEPKSQFLRAFLSRVDVRARKNQYQTLARAESEALTKRFGTTAFEGRWVRLDRFPEGRGIAEELIETARQVPGFTTPPPQPVPGGHLRILGVVCSEEVRQGEFEDAWLFAVELKLAGKKGGEGRYVVHGERLSPFDLGERIPSLRGLEGKTVAVAGLGALGAPIVAELARGQVGELRILDHDTVAAGTVVRWPRGISGVGHLKTGMLEHWVSLEYPFTRLRTFPLQIGGTPGPGEEPGPSEADVLTEFLDGVDILIDATAEIGIQQLLSALADQANIPQVYVWATEGGWGGVVARVVPGETGCWRCLQLRLEDESIVPPPLAETGTVQPRGCGAPTWTGTSFDALPVIAQAVRTACFTALAGRTGELDGPRDVFVCAQQAEGPAQLAAPDWTSYELAPHSGCSCSGNAPAT